MPKLTQRQKTAKKVNRKERSKDYFGQVANNLISGENKKINLAEDKYQASGPKIAGGGAYAHQVASDIQATKLEDSAKNLNSLVSIEGGDLSGLSATPLSRGGGIGSMNMGGPDKTDMSSNASALYRKKMGY